MYRHCLLLLAGSFLVLAAGCQQNNALPASGNDLTAVPVSQPVERLVTNFVDFTGRTDAVQAVDLRARVTGFLTKLPFREGSEVREGELLFEIDPRPYQAQLDQALSQVELNEASLKLAQKTYDRDRAIAVAVPNAVSQQQLDQDLAAVDEAAARVKASKASTEVYKLNLEFTRVTSPIDGQISRYYMTRGNLVNQDQTLLSTVVSLDPMYAYFDMDEPTLLRIRRAIREGRISLPEDGTMTVLMGLQGEEGFPHQGTINFLNNQVNSATGSISMRGVFPNPISSTSLPQVATSSVGSFATSIGPGALLALPAPLPASLYSAGSLTLLPVRTAGLLASPPGAASLLALPAPLPVKNRSTRLLSPGMFVRIRLPIGEPRRSLLVIDRAIQSDQGLKFVYVIDADNKVQYRHVTTRALEPDGLRVIEGAGPEEYIVVGGLQQVRPKMQIKADKVAMPTIGRTAPGETPPASPAK